MYYSIRAKRGSIFILYNIDYNIRLNNIKYHIHYSEYQPITVIIADIPQFVSYRYI
jgi:hypothetical protein